MTTRTTNVTERRMFTGAVFFAALSLSLLSGTARGSPAPSAKPDDAVRYADELSKAFENAAAVIRPSLVSIRAVEHFKTTAHRQQVMPQSPGSPDWAPFGGQAWIQRFFNFQLPENLPPTQGIGSGVIVSSDGYVLSSRSRLIVMSSSSGASGKAGFCGLDGLISPMIDH